MADRDKCLASLKALAEKLGLNEKEVSDIVDQIEIEKSNLDSTRPLDDEETRFDEAAKKVENEVLRRALKEKRNASLGLKALLAGIDRVNEHFTDNNSAHSIVNDLVGTLGNVPGAHRSAAYDAAVNWQRWVRGIVSELEDTGVFELAISGQLDAQIRSVAYEPIGGADPNLRLSDEARKVHAILDKYKAIARRQENAAGGDIGELVEHVFQSWDRYKLMRDKHGKPTDPVTAKKDWMDFHRQEGDFLRILGTNDPIKVEEYLNSFYSATLSGNNLVILGKQGPLSQYATKLGTDRSRNFHFKDARGAQISADRYGKGSIIEGVLHNLMLSAQTTSLMKRFGPKIREGFEARRKLLLIRAEKEYRRLTKGEDIEKEINAWESAVDKDEYLKELYRKRDNLAEFSESTKAIDNQIEQRIKSNPVLEKIYTERQTALKAQGKKANAVKRNIDILSNRGWIDRWPNLTLENMFKHVTGELYAGDMTNISKLANIARAMQSMADLGRATISSMGDLGNFYKEARAGGDDKFMDIHMELLTRLARKVGETKVTKGTKLGKIPFTEIELSTPFSTKSVPESPTSQAEEGALRLIGGALQSWMSNPAQRFHGEEELTGFTSKITGAMFKFNLMTPWTDTNRETAQLIFSRGAAFRRDKSYADLVKEGDEIVGLFEEFNITPDRWELIRTYGPTHLGNGMVVMSGDKILSAPRLGVERAMAGEAITKLGNDIGHLQSGIARREKELAKMDAPDKLAEREAALVGLAADQKQMDAIRKKAKKLEKDSQEYKDLNKALKEIKERSDTTRRRLKKLAAERETLVSEIKSNEALIEKFTKRRETLEEFKENYDSNSIDEVEYYDNKNFLFTNNEVLDFKESVALDLNTYVIQRAERAILAPTPYVMAAKQMGFNKNSMEGIAIASVMQYKTFAMGQFRDVLGRDLYGDLPPGTSAFSRDFYEHHKKDVKDNGIDSSLGKMARYMVRMAILGYLAMSIKHLLDGKEPRDPTDPKVWMAAWLQSGAGGLYGDLIFGTEDRFGRSPLISILGPTAGRLDDLIRLGVRGRETLAGAEDKDFLSHALRVGLRNIPGANTFFLKPAIDYLIIHELQEVMNPGYLKRMEKRIEEMHEQQYYLRPSEVVK